MLAQEPGTDVAVAYTDLSGRSHSTTVHLRSGPHQ